MSDQAAQLIDYISSGYSITSVSRSGRDRIIRLQAAFIKVFSPSLQLSEASYRQAMAQLIAYLSEIQAAGDRVDIQTSHYGQEWVEIRDRHGRVRNRLALSSRTIDVLKHNLEARSNNMHDANGLEDRPAS